MLLENWEMEATVEERPGRAGFTMLLEPPNEAPAKACFGRCAPLTSGKHNRSQGKSSLGRVAF